MNSTIKITLLEDGDVAGEYVFSRPTRFIVGRAVDCDVCVPADYLHQDVSRHHCAIEIDPPHVRVFDLQSRNGTYVNGSRIGRREDYPHQDDPANEASYAVELYLGDEVQVGRSATLRVTDLPPPEFALQRMRLGAIDRGCEGEPTNDCYH